jgi:adenylate cyclase
VITFAALRNLVHWIAHIGVLPDDTDDVRLGKATLTLSVMFIIPLSTVWVGLYGAFGLWLSAAIPGAYQVLSVISLVVFARTKHFPSFCYVQLSLMCLLPVLLQWSLGGFVASSGIILWSFIAPLGALLCLDMRRAIPWFGVFLVALAFSGLIEPVLSRHAAELPSWLRIGFFTLNMAAVTTTTFLVVQYFVRGRDEAKAALDAKHRELLAEQDRSERLLLNVLPAPIAERLKSGETLIADHVPGVTVLFADIVGFTPLTERIEAGELVTILNDLFSAFDRLAHQHGLEKIKTIGDSYMLVGGLPEPRDDHASAVANMALDMLDVVSTRVEDVRHELTVRIGIATGPVVAGVIGQHKFSYDLWGDTVNMASRMASQGAPGKIQVTEAVFLCLRDGYEFIDLGPKAIKGKGSMDVFALVGRKDAALVTPGSLSVPRTREGHSQRTHAPQ